MQLAGDRVNVPRDHVGGEDVGAEGVWVAEEVGEGYGGEGVVVGEGGFVEFDHGDGFMKLIDLVVRWWW